jgi:integrase
MLRDSSRPLEKLQQPKSGAHAFRRFRATWLRKQHAPEDLIRFWLGHENKSVTDVYSKLKEDVAFRKRSRNKSGSGLDFRLRSPKLHPIAPTQERGHMLRK